MTETPFTWNPHYGPWSKGLFVILHARGQPMHSNSWAGQGPSLLKAPDFIPLGISKVTGWLSPGVGLCHDGPSSRLSMEPWGPPEPL